MPSADNTAKRKKFTVGRIAAFKCPPDKKECLFWDTHPNTLALRVRAGGSKTYYFQSRYDGKVIKLKIGRAENVTIEQAQNAATALQALIDRGIDPRIHKQEKIKQQDEKRAELKRKAIEAKRREITFAEAWETYRIANQDDWSTTYALDHKKAMQRGGEKRQRSKKKTVSGGLYFFHNTPLGDIDAELILEWLTKEKKTRPTHAAKCYRMMRACLNWCESQKAYAGIVDVYRLFKNPTLKKALPKPKARHDALEKQQLPVWFETVKDIDNPVISAYLQTLLLTGARRNEIARLRWEDVDFKWQSMRIKDKVESERIIPLTPYVARLLSALPRRNDFIFSSPMAASGRLEEPYRKHANAVALAGLPHVSIHGLRRSFGSLSEWVECPVGIVAQIQGHKPSATAEKHYRVRPLDLLRMWHTKIEKEILGFAGIQQPEPMTGNAPLRVIK